MMSLIRITTITAIFLAGSLYACSTCFGDPNSAATQGMNWAIISLLVTTGGVLSGIVLSIRKLANRSKTYWENKGA
jgi:Na+/proline symporter